MSTPKRHHYLPQFYLENFCRDKGFWVFDRDKDEFRQQTPKNTTLKSHYYSVEDQYGNKHTKIESFLSQIEGCTKPVIEKLLARDSISEEEKEKLSIFVAFMMNRVPDFEKSVNTSEAHMIKRMADLMFTDKEQVQSMLDEHERDTGEKHDVSAEELVEFHKSGQYDIVIHRNESLRLMLSLSFEIAHCFHQMYWEVFHAPPKTSFVTTDNPVVLLPPANSEPGVYGVGILTIGARKVFPMSQTACLVMYDHGNLLVHRNADKQSVRSINLTVTSHADRFVIGRDEALVRNMVATTQLVERKREGRFRVG